MPKPEFTHNGTDGSPFHHPLFSATEILEVSKAEEDRVLGQRGVANSVVAHGEQQKEPKTRDRIYDNEALLSEC